MGKKLENNNQDHEEKKRSNFNLVTGILFWASLAVVFFIVINAYLINIFILPGKTVSIILTFAILSTVLNGLALHFSKNID